MYFVRPISLALVMSALAACSSNPKNSGTKTSALDAKTRVGLAAVTSSTNENVFYIRKTPDGMWVADSDGNILDNAVEKVLFDQRRNVFELGVTPRNSNSCAFGANSDNDRKSKGYTLCSSNFGAVNTGGTAATQVLAGVFTFGIFTAAQAATGHVMARVSFNEDEFRRAVDQAGIPALAAARQQAVAAELLRCKNLRSEAEAVISKWRITPVVKNVTGFDGGPTEKDITTRIYVDMPVEKCPTSVSDVKVKFEAGFRPTVGEFTLAPAAEVGGWVKAGYALVKTQMLGTAPGNLSPSFVVAERNIRKYAPNMRFSDNNVELQLKKIDIANRPVIGYGLLNKSGARVFVDSISFYFDDGILVRKYSNSTYSLAPMQEDASEIAEFDSSFSKYSNAIDRAVAKMRSVRSARDAEQQLIIGVEVTYSIDGQKKTLFQRRPMKFVHMI